MFRSFSDVKMKVELAGGSEVAGWVPRAEGESGLACWGLWNKSSGSWVMNWRPENIDEHQWVDEGKAKAGWSSEQGMSGRIEAQFSG